jgi:hypothetical protein
VAVVSVWGADARVRDRLDALGAQAARAAGELERALAGRISPSTRA